VSPFPSSASGGEHERACGELYSGRRARRARRDLGSGTAAQWRCAAHVGTCHLHQVARIEERVAAESGIGNRGGMRIQSVRRAKGPTLLVGVGHMFIR